MGARDLANILEERANVFAGNNKCDLHIAYLRYIRTDEGWLLYKRLCAEYDRRQKA